MVGYSPKAPRIALITKSSESNFWKTVFAGARAAANEYSVEVFCESPKEEDDYDTQNRLIESAFEEGYDALILSACDYEKTAPSVLKVLDAGMTVVTIDSPVHVDKELTQISTDNLEAGRAAARAMLARMEGKTIVAGIVNFEERSGNGTLRQQGFLQEAKTLGITVADIRYSFSNAQSPMEETAQMLEEHPEMNAIVTLNEWTTIGVGAALRQGDMARDITVIGFDTNIQSIEDLEDGVIDSLIVQNPFAMGYLGVSKAIEQLQKHTLPEIIDTSTQVITKENMYNPENQKLVFPFFL